MEGTISRRVIPSDNSCLFNVVGYVMDHDKQKAPELRQVIAATVASDPTKYSEAFLGKPNQEYCAWILNPEKWGDNLQSPVVSWSRKIVSFYTLLCGAEKLGKKLSNGVYCNVATRSSSSNEELTVLAMVGERFGLQQLDLLPVGVSGH